MTLTAEQKRYLRLVQNEPVKFGQWLGFKDLTELHNDWIKSFLFEKEDQTLLAHRGSYKSTSLILALAFMAILYPNKAIIFFRKTDNDVTEAITQIQKALMSSNFQRLAYVLYGVELAILKGTMSEIDTNLKTSPRGASQILGLGIKTSITGKHGDIIVTDDIVNVNDRISKPERNRVKLQYQELQNVKNRGGRFINTGTPWHKEDAISLMPNVRKYDVYSTGLVDKPQMQQLRDSMTPSLFSANYELKHIADNEAMFEAPTFIDSAESIYNGFGHIDAAFGGSDSTAYTILKELKDGSFIGFGKRWHKHVDECIGEIKVYHEALKAGTIYLETNADKGYLAKRLKSEGLVTKTYHENQNKFIKISTYLKQYWSQIKWLDETDPDYMTEILDYTEHAEHDDSPDSAASLIREIKNRQKWLV